MSKKKGGGHSDNGERLQKVLAWAGVGSRRECEELITDGRVEIDRQVVTELGTRVDPQSQEIRVDGVPLPRPKRQYYLLNKPTGVVCTNRDPQGRARVIDLVPASQRLFHVGRLDRTSEGLILVTNDGELAHRLTHPRYGIAKTYRATVAGHPDVEELNKLRTGVHLAEGLAAVDSIKIKKRHAKGTDLEIVLREGRNREIRRILARIGHKVLRLTRVGLGPLRIEGLASGEFRRLDGDEVKALWKFVEGRAAKTPQKTGPEKKGAGKKGAAQKGKGAAPKGAPKPGPTRGKKSTRPPTPRPEGAILGYEEGWSAEPEAKKKRKKSAKRDESGQRAAKKKRPASGKTDRQGGKKQAGKQHSAKKKASRSKRPKSPRKTGGRAKGKGHGKGRPK